MTLLIAEGLTFSQENEALPLCGLLTKAAKAAFVTRLQRRALGLNIRLGGLHGLEGALQQLTELPAQQLCPLLDGLPGAAGGKALVLELLFQSPPRG